MGCKITKTIEHRKITEDEFKKQKGSEPYSTYRQSSKKLNFLMIFGGGAKLFAEQALETEWTPQQIDDFINENNCQEDLAEVTATYKNESPQKLKYIAVAKRMRDNFFNAYPGLQTRIDREFEFVKKNGYAESIFGDRRHLIELKLAGSWDKKHLSGMLSNLKNVCANYRAQNYESCTRGTAMRQMVDWLEEKKYKTFIDNEIHDSIDLCVEKTELKDVLAHLKHLCERRLPEYADRWVPLDVDCEISDLNKGQYYKGGSSPESYGLHWEGLEYEDPDPFNVELSKEYERAYFEKRKEHWAKLGRRDPLQKKIASYIEENLTVKIPVRQIRSKS